MNKYRLVLLDSTGIEVGVVTSLTVQPNDLIVIMPEPGGMWTDAFCNGVARAFEDRDMEVMVFALPVVFARLEVVEP